MKNWEKDFDLQWNLTEGGFWVSPYAEDGIDADRVKAFIRKLLEEEPTRQMEELISRCKGVTETKAQCADELERCVELKSMEGYYTEALLDKSDLDNLIKKWRVK